MTTANSSMIEDVKTKGLAEYVTRLQAGETIPMSALVYLRLTEYVQALPDESTFQEFGRLASTRNERLSLGIISVYDISLKSHSSDSTIEVTDTDKLSLVGAERVIAALDYHSSRYSSSDSEYHYFLVTRQAGAPETELRFTLARQDDGQFQIHTRDALSDEWEILDSISSDWSQEEN